jgi:hypothetical protein
MAIVIAASIAAIAPMCMIYLTFRKNAKGIQENTKSLAEIHVLVNSRLTEALDEIASLKNRIDAKDAVIADQTKDKN